MTNDWLMWVTTKSSYRLLAPGAKLAGVRDGFFARHFTALIHSFRSFFERVPLELLSEMVAQKPRYRAWCGLPFSPYAHVLEGALVVEKPVLRYVPDQVEEALVKQPRCQKRPTLRLDAFWAITAVSVLRYCSYKAGRGARGRKETAKVHDVSEVQSVPAQS